ncbi:MAG: hypothetical protein ACOY93_08735 [Bacillota bacterium]
MTNTTILLAQVRQRELQELVPTQGQMVRAIEADKADHDRFIKAYRLRRLLNRFAPSVALRFGF